MSPALAGKAHRDNFVHCCCLLILWQQLGHRCNMGICIFWWSQRSHIKVKGHLRSSCKIGWKCESGLIWKVEAWLEPNLVYWYNMWPFICWCGQRSYTKVKGHLRSSCEIGWKCENGLIWKVEVWLEPNLVYWYNMGAFICSCSQRSYTKAKGHLRSSCKIVWKCENGLICKVDVWFEPNLVYWYSMGTFICDPSQQNKAVVCYQEKCDIPFIWKNILLTQRWYHSCVNWMQHCNFMVKNKS